PRLLSYSYLPLFVLHAFPTRRSSDLVSLGSFFHLQYFRGRTFLQIEKPPLNCAQRDLTILFSTYLSFTLISRKLFNATKIVAPIDRKSTRLNSSHVSISYAVFCLKTK